MIQLVCILLRNFTKPFCQSELEPWQVPMPLTVRRPRCQMIGLEDISSYFAGSGFLAGPAPPPSLDEGLACTAMAIGPRKEEYYPCLISVYFPRFRSSERLSMGVSVLGTAAEGVPSRTNVWLGLLGRGYGGCVPDG